MGQSRPIARLHAASPTLSILPVTSGEQTNMGDGLAGYPVQAALAGVSNDRQVEMDRYLASGGIIVISTTCVSDGWKAGAS